MIDTRRYIFYLLNKFSTAGGNVIRRKINQIDEVSVIPLTRVYDLKENNESCIIHVVRHSALG